MTLKKIKIKNNTLKNYGRPFIVAEVGINHNGSLKRALKMIDIAKKSGCDAVKFQTFKADELVFDKKLKFTYFSKGKKISESMNLMFKRNELNDFDWKKIQKYCKQKKIVFFSTCSVYGAQDDILNETSPTDPLSVYASTKLEAEKILSDKNALIFRLGTLFGIGDSYSRIRMDLVVNVLTAKAINDKKLTVFGGRQFRPLLHVKDAARVIEESIRSENKGIYNLKVYTPL